jgi:hypothetical protein
LGSVVPGCGAAQLLGNYALLSLLPVLGGGLWMVQQYLAPMLKALPQ